MSEKSWPKLANDMLDEGFWFVVDRSLVNNRRQSGSSRQVSIAGPMNGSSAHVESAVADPVDALADLLAKCRERWPSKHRWDDLDLDQLLTTARLKDWQPSVFWNSWRRAWCAATSDAEIGICNVNEPAIALREAMKARERKESR